MGASQIETGLPEAARKTELSPLVNRLQGGRIHLIPTTVWLDEMAQKYNGRTGASYFTLASVPDEEWDTLQGEGIDALYFLGIFKRGDAAKAHALIYAHQYKGALPSDYNPSKDVIGSPFAHVGYDELDPLVARDWEEFDRIAREKLIPRGMVPGVDFVPNHTGMDHPWIGTHHDFYIRGTKEEYHAQPGRFIDEPFFDENGEEYHIAHGWHEGAYDNMPWTDTAQLNLANSEVQECMIQDAVRMVEEHEIYMLRFDMVHISLREKFEKSWGNKVTKEQLATLESFWPRLISQAKAAAKRNGHDLICVAETYEKRDELLALGFDFVYGDDFYKHQRGVAKGELSAKDISEYLKWTPNLWREVHYQENHDESRAASAIDSHGNGGLGDELRARAFATISAFRDKGVWMTFHGQEEARVIRPPAQTRRVRNESREDKARAEYNKAYFMRLYAWRNSDLLRNRQNRGDSTPIADAAGNDTHHNIIVQEARKDKQGVICCVNSSAHEIASCYVRLPQNAVHVRVVNMDTGEFLDSQASLQFVEGEEYARLFMQLHPWKSQLVLYDLSDAPVALAA